MESMPNYTNGSDLGGHNNPGNDRKPNDLNDGVDALDMDMVADFGDGIGVDMNFDNTDVKDSDLIVQHQLTPSLSPNPPPMSGGSNGMQGSHLAPPTMDVNDMFQAETGLDDDDDDDDDGDAPATKRPRGPSGHPDVPGGFTLVDKDGDSGRRKIRIEYISDKSRRHITFSKRKAGIMKKAYELSTLTGTQVLLLVVSETGLVYTFTTAKLQPLVTKPEGKNLIQACLNAPDGILPDGTPSGGPVPATKGKGGGLAIRPHKLTAAATAAMAASAAQQSMGSHQAEHAQQQTELHQQIGQGTPGRPKKRMPSGKLKKGQQLEMGLGGPDTLPPPPVPQIPDMHRNANSPHMMNALQSPLSAGHYIPPEYQQHQQQQQHPVQHQQPGPPYYQQPGDYNPAYYGPGPNAGGPQGNGHVHPQATQGQPQQQQQQQQPPPPQGYSYNISQEQLAYQRSQQEHARLMMDPRRNMGMGM